LHRSHIFSNPSSTEFSAFPLPSPGSFYLFSRFLDYGRGYRVSGNDDTRYRSTVHSIL
jgi:hypothetical protein